eukprot:361810-Chlamydomonas_euryale.AAC.4
MAPAWTASAQICPCRHWRQRRQLRRTRQAPQLHCPASTHPGSASGCVGQPGCPTHSLLHRRRPAARLGHCRRQPAPHMAAESRQQSSRPAHGVTPASMCCRASTAVPKCGAGRLLCPWRTYSFVRRAT